MKNQRQYYSKQEQYHDEFIRRQLIFMFYIESYDYEAMLDQIEADMKGWGINE